MFLHGARLALLPDEGRDCTASARDGQGEADRPVVRLRNRGRAPPHAVRPRPGSLASGGAPLRWPRAPCGVAHPYAVRGAPRAAAAGALVDGAAMSMELPRDYNAAVDLVGRNLARRASKVAYIDDAG